MIKIKNEPNITPIKHVLLQYKIQIRHYYFDKRQIVRQNMRKRLMNFNRSKYFSLKHLNSSQNLNDTYHLPLISQCSCNSFLTCKENVSLGNSRINYSDACTQTSLNFVEMDFILDFIRVHSSEFRSHFSVNNQKLLVQCMDSCENECLIIPEKTTEPFFLHKDITIKHNTTKLPTDEGDSKDKCQTRSKYNVQNEIKKQEITKYSNVEEIVVKESSRLKTPLYAFDQEIQKQNTLLMAELKKTLKRPNFNLKSLNTQ